MKIFFVLITSLLVSNAISATVYKKETTDKTRMKLNKINIYINLKVTDQPENKITFNLDINKYNKLQEFPAIKNQTRNFWNTLHKLLNLLGISDEEIIQVDSEYKTAQFFIKNLMINYY